MRLRPRSRGLSATARDTPPQPSRPPPAPALPPSSAAPPASPEAAASAHQAIKWRRRGSRKSTPTWLNGPRSRRPGGSRGGRVHDRGAWRNPWAHGAQMFLDFGLRSGGAQASGLTTPHLGLHAIDLPCAQGLQPCLYGMFVDQVSSSIDQVSKYIDAGLQS